MSDPTEERTMLQRALDWFSPDDEPEEVTPAPVPNEAFAERQSTRLRDIPRGIMTQIIPFALEHTVGDDAAQAFQRHVSIPASEAAETAIDAVSEVHPITTAARLNPMARRVVGDRPLHRVLSAEYSPEAAGIGALDGATFGHFDEVVGLAGAALGDGGTATQRYRSARDQVRANMDASQQHSPGSVTAGAALGATASALPTMGAAAPATASQVMRTGAGLGALTGLGTSEADLTRGDVGGAAADTITGGAVGALAAGIVPAAGAAGRAASSLGPVRAALRYADEVLDPSAAMYRIRTTGTTLPQARQILQRHNVRGRGVDAAAMDAAAQLDRLGISPRRSLRTASQVASAAENVEHQGARALDQLAAEMADVGGAVNTRSVADRLRGVAGEFDDIADSGPLRRYIGRYADDVERIGGESGAMPFDALRANRTQLRRGISWNQGAAPGSEVSPRTDAQRRMYAALSDALEESVENNLGASGIQRWRQANDQYAGGTTFRRMANDREARDTVNQFISSSDMAMGGLGALSDSDATPEERVGRFLAGAAINKLYRSREPAIQAAMREWLSDAIRAGASRAGSMPAMPEAVRAVLGQTASVVDNPRLARAFVANLARRMPAAAEDVSPIGPDELPMPATPALDLLAPESGDPGDTPAIDILLGGIEDDLDEEI